MGDQKRKKDEQRSCRNGASNTMIEAQEDCEKRVRQSVKVAERFCWNSSLPLNQLMLSCHLQEQIRTSSMKTQVCVLLADILKTQSHNGKKNKKKLKHKLLKK